MTNLPVSGKFNVTAIFGQKGKYWSNGHKGVDIVCSNTNIYATCNGTVRVIGYDANGWGRYVSIGDNNGNIHLFCHLVYDSIKVKKGDKVNRSTIIGTMGTTGNSSGVHLHYQINDKNGNPINPCDHLGIPNKKGEYNSAAVKTSPFKDVNTDHWAYKHIINLYDKKIISGYSDGTYKPSDVITRAEAASIIFSSCKRLMSSNFNAFYTKKFKDVPKTHWAYDEVTVIHNMGIVSGYTDGKYKPNNKITRAEIAVMIRKMMDIISKPTIRWTKSFTDVEEKHWAYTAINDLYNIGIISGKSSGKFAPKDLVTRAEVAVIVNSVFKYYNK